MNFKGIFVDKKELVKARIIEDFRAGRLSRKDAAMMLNVCERSVSRWAEKHRENGIHGLRHGNCERDPINKLRDDLASEAVRLYQEIYPDFNMVHCLEMLENNHALKISYTTFRQICRKAGIGKRYRRRASSHRVYRERMANEGMFLQMDGSHHVWNGKDKWCLIALIDDATSNIPAAAFYAGETTWACMNTLRMVIESRGLPEVIYTDEAGWAGGGSKRPNFSQFVRACDELGIRVITASSPQAKGRIERCWRTLQDRLVAEMRLYSIVTMTDANRYLQQVFLPIYWDKENTVVPTNPASRYRLVPSHLNLNEVLCMKYLRQVRRDHCVSFDNQNYKILNREYGPLCGKDISIHVQEDGSVSLYYGTQKLSIQLVVKPTRNWSKHRA
jgi:transposase